MVKVVLTIDLEDEKKALSVYGSLSVDDDDYVSTRLEGSTVTAEVEADTVDGARRAADDWLACLMAAVK